MMFQLLLVTLMFQGYPAGSPEAVAEKYMKDLQAGDYQAMAEAFAEDEIKYFKDTMAEVLKVAKGTEAEAIIYPMFGLTSDDDIDKVDARKFFAVFFKGIMNQIQGVKFSKLEILGHVMEGEIAHVVTRTAAEGAGISMTQMEVVSAKKENGQWRLMMSGKMKGIAATLRGQMGL